MLLVLGESLVTKGSNKIRATVKQNLNCYNNKKRQIEILDLCFSFREVRGHLGEVAKDTSGWRIVDWTDGTGLSCVTS